MTRLRPDAAEGIAAAVALADRGRRQEAAAAIARLRARIEAAARANRNPTTFAHTELLAADLAIVSRGCASASAYTPHGAMLARTIVASHSHQRSTAPHTEVSADVVPTYPSTAAPRANRRRRAARLASNAPDLPDLPGRNGNLIHQDQIQAARMLGMVRGTASRTAIPASSHRNTAAERPPASARLISFRPPPLSHSRDARLRINNAAELSAEQPSQKCAADGPSGTASHDGAKHVCEFASAYADRRSNSSRVGGTRSRGRVIARRLRQYSGMCLTRGVCNMKPTLDKGVKGSVRIALL